MGLRDFIDNVRHNRELYRSGRANRNIVQNTTVGWRPDPWNEDDGFVPDPGNLDEDDKLYKSNVDHNTPSGNREYHRVIRRNGRR